MQKKQLKFQNFINKNLQKRKSIDKRRKKGIAFNQI